MTNQAKIDRHVYKGFDKAARRLGSKFVQYRPRSTGPVLVKDNIVSELWMATDPTEQFSFNRPHDYDQSEYFALLDLTYIQPGDYMSDGDLTYFVAWIEHPAKPAEIILCNRVVDIFQPATSNTYGGNTGPILKMHSWPCSILPGTKGERSVTNLPGSIRAPWLDIKIPKYTTVAIEPFDLIIDDLTRRYILSDVSLAKEGYHISCSYENAAV